jgi:hypothetical protein
MNSITDHFTERFHGIAAYFLVVFICIALVLSSVFMVVNTFNPFQDVVNSGAIIVTSD